MGLWLYCNTVSGTEHGNVLILLLIMDRNVSLFEKCNERLIGLHSIVEWEQ